MSKVPSDPGGLPGETLMALESSSQWGAPSSPGNLHMCTAQSEGPAAAVLCPDLSREPPRLCPTHVPLSLWSQRSLAGVAGGISTGQHQCEDGADPWLPLPGLCPQLRSPGVVWAGKFPAVPMDRACYNMHVGRWGNGWDN